MISIQSSGLVSVGTETDSIKDLSWAGVGCWIQLGLVNIKVDRYWNLSDALHKYSVEYIDG